MRAIILFMLAPVFFSFSYLFLSISVAEGQNIAETKIDKEKLRKQYQEIVSNYSLHLRAKEENHLYLLDWDLSKDGKNGELSLIELDLSNNQEKIEKIKVTKEIFLKFIFNRGSLNFKKNSLIAKDSLNALKSDDGQVAIRLPVKFDKKELLFVHKIVLSSLNSLNYWDGNPNNTPEEQLYIYDIFRESFSNWYDLSIQKAKADNFMTEIKLALVPDIVALQEIEYADGKNENFLPNSYFRLELEKLGYRYFYLGGQSSENPTAITTAFISKYKMKNEMIPFNVDLPEFSSFSKKEKHAAHYTTRSMQLGILEYPNSKIYIVNNHWRSQGCGDEKGCDLSLRIRNTNATVVKNYLKKNVVNDIFSDMILIGDFNASYWTEPLVLLGSSGKEDAVQTGKDEQLYYNLWYELPEKERWEVSHEGQYDTLSQIITNRGSYDAYGLQYADNSFSVVGHNGYAKTILLDADNNPFRWQERRFRPDQLEDSKLKEKIEGELAKRNCKKNSQKRNCKLLYWQFFGIGYVDHLPLVAEFNFLGDIFTVKNPFHTKFNPSSTSNIQKSSELDIPIERCKENEEFLDLTKLSLDIKNINMWFKKCVKLDFTNSPLPLKTTGIYNTNLVEIAENRVTLSIVHAFDNREIKEEKILGISTKNMDQLSNMCFARKILQGEGGKLAYIYGRLGFMEGAPSVVIARRSDIKLVDLPYNKSNSCQNQNIDMDR